jgi:hypothetical protein
MQCKNHSQWIEFRAIVGEWQAGFWAIASFPAYSAIADLLACRDLVAETSQQLSLESKWN